MQYEFGVTKRAELSKMIQDAITRNPERKVTVNVTSTSDAPRYATGGYIPPIKPAFKADPQSYGHGGILPDAAPADDDMEPVHLIGDGSHAKWAEEFCDRNPSASYDYMLPWFANAIHTGKMIERKVQEDREWVKKMREQESKHSKDKVERAHAMAKEALATINGDPGFRKALEEQEAVAMSAHNAKRAAEKEAVRAEIEKSRTLAAEYRALGSFGKSADEAGEKVHIPFPESLARFFGGKVNLR